MHFNEIEVNRGKFDYLQDFLFEKTVAFICGFFFLLRFSSSASRCCFSVSNADHTCSHFSLAHLSFSSLDSLLCHFFASSFFCSVILTVRPLWSFFMCASLSALTWKIFRHSPQMKMCLSVMWLSSSLLLPNPFMHSVHAKYFFCFACSSAFSFLHSLCSCFSSLCLCISSSCSIRLESTMLLFTMFLQFLSCGRNVMTNTTFKVMLALDVCV